MADIIRLFRLLELTRSQPQYGYALAGLPKAELSDLAQHHYLVTFMAWRLARRVKEAGGAIDTERTLEISLVHDLGELFGGDIGMPYAKANPDAAKLAKQFEEANQLFIATQFGEDREYVEGLLEEAKAPKTVEAVTAKIADYVEVAHFKLYANILTKDGVEMVAMRMRRFLESLNDVHAKKALADFVEEWSAEMAKGGFEDFFEAAKSAKE